MTVIPEHVAEWPEFIVDCVNEFGAVEVDRVGKQVLGFPPAWLRTRKEAAAVRAALTKGTGQ